jgi:hypothetical protein
MTFPRSGLFASTLPRSVCGTKKKLKNGGFVQCDKPGLLVEMTLQERSFQCVMCTDHITKHEEAGHVIRIVEDGYIPRLPPKMRELFATGTCQICNRLFGEHSAREFDDHHAQIAAPTVRLYPKGKKATRESLARVKCPLCSRLFRDHSQEEYVACSKQHTKRTKLPQEHFKYVTCEVCGRKFGEHSSQEYDGCVDTIIDRSFL